MNLIPEHMPARRAELYEDLVGFVERQLTEYGVEKPGAEAIANAMADHLADYWGGQLINFPRDYKRLLSAREVEIYERLSRGETVGALSREYGMTERGIYKLAKRVRARLEANAKNRPQLFDIR